MRQRLGAAAARALSQLHGAPAAAGRLGLRPAGALAAGGACAAACAYLRGRWLGGSPAPGSVAGIGGMAAAEAAFFTSAHSEQGPSRPEEELGDLRPGMTLSEEEDDEVEHYSVRAHIHRRRLKPHEESHLDEEEPPTEEAPGEEAYKEAGPLLPPDSEEEDILSDEELTARK